MTDKKDIDKRFIRFNWRKDKKLFCRLFLRCFFTQAVGYTVAFFVAAIPVIKYTAQIHSEKNGYPVSLIDGAFLLHENKHFGDLMFAVLMPAVIAFFLINNFFYEINKFGDDPEWKKRYIAGKIKTEKTNNLLVIIAALCLINYLSFAGI